MAQQTEPLPITQVAIVVHDIRDALEKYHRALGWGPWNVYEHKPPALHDTYLHGKPAEYSMIGAETHAGPVVVELLQPLEGDSIYKEWLEEHGEGMHHIAVMRPTQEQSDETKQHFADAGAERPDGRPHRRDDRVLLPRHRALAESHHRVGAPGTPST